MSPLGNHSLTISVEDGEGFQAESTVDYFLEDDTKPTGLLTVTGDSATVEFTGRGPVKDYRCQLDMMEYYECKIFLKSLHEDASDISMQALVLRGCLD